MVAKFESVIKIIINSADINQNKRRVFPAVCCYEKGINIVFNYAEPHLKVESIASFLKFLTESISVVMVFNSDDKAVISVSQ